MMITKIDCLMKKTPYEVRIQIADNDVPTLFRDCLCSGSVGFGALRLEYGSDAYAEAKESLLERRPEGDYGTLCWEDVITEMLRIGKTLTFIDVEDEETIYLVNLETIRKNVAKIEVHHLSAILNEQDDAITHDSILQTLIMGEIIYG